MLEVAATWQLKVPVAVPFAGGVIVAGAVHVTPGGRLAGRLTVTGELKPLVEVMVMVEAAAAPVIEFKIRGVELTVKTGPVGGVTLKENSAPRSSNPLHLPSVCNLSRRR